MSLHHANPVADHESAGRLLLDRSRERDAAGASVRQIASAS
jgi:hypothetical protein